MDDDTRAALDAEAPVNPYSLLDSVNTASARTNALWLVFLGLMAYLLIAVAAVTHRDLLLNSGVLLPILQVRIDLVRFFLLAPAILALLHLGLVAQFALLARKALEFNNALRLLESTDLRSHPLRLELDSFFYVQAIAGPERSRLVSGFLNGIGWLTLLLLPLLLLLYVQVAFLPFHDPLVTSVHRGILLADIALLLFIGVFLLRTETSFFGALLRTGLSNPGSLVFGLAALAGAAFVSVVLATIPGGVARDDRASAAFGADGALLGIFPRNLNVADANLVAGTEAAPATRSISLRGRDLRFARLDRVDLRQADLTGANLDGASLAGADLRGVRLRCADNNAAQQPEDRSKAQCASARGADFSAAQLADASLVGADLRGAKFDDAALEGADLGNGLMSGASFERARLQRASLSGASLQGTSFVLANLQGAGLAGAKLQMADLTGAALQGANLSLARLAGAVLRDADLEGADLQKASLYGADLRGAKLHAADLAGATVWRAGPPGGDAVQQADLANIVMKAPGKADLDLVKAAVAGIDSPALGERAGDLSALFKSPEPDGAWAESADGQAWAALLRASEAAMAEGYRARLAEHLARMGCRSRFADGAVAAGIARRALAQGFKGDAGAIYDRLKAGDCPAAKTVPPRALLDLAAAVEAAKVQ
jgi:uncharacterized protein YjbI with pentapeptide repeats